MEFHYKEDADLQRLNEGYNMSKILFAYLQEGRCDERL